MKKIFYLIFFVPFVFSCKGPSETSLDKVKWIEGKWEGVEGSNVFVENWALTNDSLMMGNGYFIEAGDTVFKEELKIEINEDGIFYVAYPEQMDLAEFKLKEFSDSRLVFENPDHDFPRIIIYEKIGPDSLSAFLEGVEEGIKRTETFRWKKVNP